MEQKELESKQSILRNKIYEKAVKLFGDENIEITEPIYDGVCDIEKYVNSPVKVMWILKEPYDDFNESDMPVGGGWDVFEEWTQPDKVEAVTKIRTWQPIMYILRGLAENKFWDDLPWIQDEREKFLEYLKSCAYLNINKMPAYKASGNLKQKYDNWSDIVLEQISCYKPDVIIFGNTFLYFRDDKVPFVVEGKSLKGEPYIVDAYKTKIGEKATLLIDAYHPNAKVKGLTRQKYVDTIVSAILTNLKEISF